MSFRGVNKELGHNRQNYSLFRFKGGQATATTTGSLRVYKKKVSEGSRASEKDISPVSNPSEVPIRPIDMPGRGAYPGTFKAESK